MSDTVSHVHSYRAKDKRFIDGCHFVTIERTCSECGAVDRQGTPRNFDLNELQVAFARQDCKLCRVLLHGREPASWKATADA